MPSKPTYEELAQDLQRLQAENDKLKHAADEKLRECEQRFNAITATALDSIFCKNLKRQYTFVNSAMAELFGCTPADLIGKVPEELFDEDTAAVIHEVDQRTYRGENVSEIRLLTIAGKRYYFHTVQVPLPDSQGNISGISGIVRDMTPFKESEEALKNEKQRAEQFFRLAGVMFVWLDVTGKVQLANNKACEVLGCRPDEIIGKDWFDSFVPQSVREHSREIFLRSIRGASESSGPYESPVLTADGKKKIVAWHNSLIREEQADMIGMLRAGEDVTIRKQLEKQVLQIRKLESIGILAGGIAHDFNNMLGIIAGNVSYLLSRYTANEELVDVLGDVQMAAERAERLTRQLLIFSQGGAPVKKTTDINHLIQDSATLITRSTHTECEFHLMDHACLAEVDRGQLSQAISNIIINAHQAMPDGGPITIRTMLTEIRMFSDIPLSAGKYIEITIADRGIGISEKHLSNIFDPYFSTKQRGSGLGLAAAFSIIKKHDGHITVKSKVEQGTTFYIYLPVSEELDGAEVEGKPVLDHVGQGKVLIMDDEEHILNMAGRIFTRMNYEPHFAKDGHQALEIYQAALQASQPFKLVILDLTIPGGEGGLATIQKLLKLDPQVNAIVSSGYSNDPVMGNYKEYGFRGVIPKPYTMDEVAKVLVTIFKDQDD